MKSVVAILVSLLAVTNALELTPETWDDAVAGKSVFIKFLAPVSKSMSHSFLRMWSLGFDS